MQTNQSSAANYKASDLQVAKYNSSFAMSHMMGLAQLTLPYKALTQTRTDNNGSISNSGTVYKTASSQFASGANTPLLFSDGGASAGKSKVLYFVFKSSATIASKTTVADAWSQAVSASAGQYAAYTVNSSRTYWKYVGTYSNPGGSASAGGGYSTTGSRGSNTATYTSKEPYTVSLQPGNYEMQCWGAAGEDWTAIYSTSHKYYGGHGAYTKGDIFIPTSRTLYVFTGNVFGYNGGLWTNSKYGASGGSSTDIRLTKGTSGSKNNWADWASRKSRIMVAAGGGGGMARDCDSVADGQAKGYYGDGNGGYGGGLSGGDGQSVNHTRAYGYNNCYGGGQNINGYYVYHDLGNAPSEDGRVYYNGYFGGSSSVGYIYQGGFGGGYYTGVSASHGGPSGGSSFISGHAGCIAVMESATEVYNENTGRSQIQHRTDANAIARSTHYSGLIFTNTVMIDGEGYQWTTSRGSYVGTPKFSGSGVQAGNPDLVGYAKITTIPDD